MGRLWILPVFALLPGCTSLEKPNHAIVAGNTFGTPPPSSNAKAGYAPADAATAQRVIAVGQKLIRGNLESGRNEMGLNPNFATIGSPEPEIFHQGTQIVWITEGLVKMCKSESDLAGLLSMELGKMVAEREALAPRDARGPQRLPPVEVPIGNAGGFHNSDGIGMVERAKFEKQYPKVGARAVRPDPNKIAVNFFEKAGYAPVDFNNIQPLLEAADRHVALERQFKGISPRGNGMP